MTQKVEEILYYHTRIKEWPEEERPREKLLRQGSQILSDAELLAILIGSGTDGVTALDLAKRLLIDHQSLKSLAGKGTVEISKMKGMGPAKGARIMAAIEIGRRIEIEDGKKAIKVNSPEDVVKMYRTVVRDLKQEIFLVILLDGGNKIIRDVTISKGTLNASLVHPREVFKAAVDHLAAGIILLHNHPSGEQKPSNEDYAITKQLLKASAIMGIPILDHIILAGNRYFSFAKQGLLMHS